MNHCTNCGADFEGNVCPNCGKSINQTAPTISFGKMIARFAPALLLLVFCVLMLGLYAAPAYGDALLPFTVYDHINVPKEMVEPIFYGCTVALIVFAAVGLAFSFVLLFTNRSLPALQYLAFAIYLPIFLCICIMAGKVGNAALLQGGLIAAIVLSIVFAAAQICVLVLQIKFGVKEKSAVAPIKKPYVIAQYPYPAPPQPKDYSKEELALYYNETLPQFNKAVELMKEHHPEYVEARRAAMRAYRAERKRPLCELYEKKHGTTCSYPLAYIWWNFSF